MEKRGDTERKTNGRCAGAASQNSNGEVDSTVAANPQRCRGESYSMQLRAARHKRVPDKIAIVTVFALAGIAIKLRFLLEIHWIFSKENGAPIRCSRCASQCYPSLLTLIEDFNSGDSPWGLGRRRIFDLFITGATPVWDSPFEMMS